MKKFLYILLIIIANVILFFAGILIYHEPAFYIKKLTVYNETVDFLLIVITLILTAVFTLSYHSPGYRLRYIAVGLCSFVPSAFVYSYFYLNREFASTGDYKTFEVRGGEWINDKLYLNINFNIYANSTEVSQDKYLEVDSVQVRVNNGLFGMKTFSNDVKIVEVDKCPDFQIEEGLNDSAFHYKAGEYYSFHRCFSKAITEYSSALNIYPDNHVIYYNRALIYIVRADYNNALHDLKTAYVIKFNSLDEADIETIRSFNRLESETSLKKAFDELSENPNQETFAEAFELMEKYPEIADLEMYSERIKFCIDKLKTTEI